MTTIDDNHGHKPLNYILSSSLGPKLLLPLIELLCHQNPLLINMRSTDGSLPLGTFLCKMCHQIVGFGTMTMIDFRKAEVQELFRENISVGVYLISQGAKCQPRLISAGQEKLAINAHLWYRKIAPHSEEVLLAREMPAVLVSLVLDYAIDMYVNLCFAPEVICDRLNQRALNRSLKTKAWQEIEESSYLDLLTLLLEGLYHEKLADWSIHPFDTSLKLF